MKHGVRSLLALVASALLGLGFTFAQDDVLQRYGTALDSLNQSITMLEADSVRSRDLLDSAAGSLRLLAPQTSSPDLITDMEQVFDRARAAIQNHSRTDLEVQVAVLRGGFQRAVLESALRTAQSDFTTARGRFERLAADLQLDATGLEQLAAATDVRQLRAAFDNAAARRIAASLERVRNELSESRERAYVTLADAYGRFLHVQDAPASDPDLNERFVALIGNLVAGEDQELGSGAAGLAETFRQLGATAIPAAGSTTPVPAAAAPAETASPAAPAAEVAAEAAAAPEAPAAPVQAAVQAAAAEAVAEAAGSLTLAEAAAQLEAERQAEVLEDLRTALARLGLRGQPGEQAAVRLQEAGFTSLTQIVDQHFALAGQLAAAATSGDPARSRQLLERFNTLYRSTLAPVYLHIQPAVNEGMLTLTDNLLAVDSVRLADVQLLLSQLGALDGNLAQPDPTLLHDAQLALGNFTLGWPRLIVTILAALLAIVPLILLGMAFGGGNRNWQLINSGFFILLLPLIYEGFTYLTDLLASLTGLAWLGFPARFSLFHSPLVQVLWLLLMIAAITLMSVGLYGICVQFGIFGTGSARQGARAPRGVTGPGKMEVKTLIDWDDEF